MKMNEKHLNDFLIKNSTKFLTSLREHCLQTSFDGISASDMKRLHNLDISQRIDRKNCVSDTNGRQSKLDIYYHTEALSIIFELKVGPIGFRGVAQAAYYNNCIEIKPSFVILIGTRMGPDYLNFSQRCIKDAALQNVIFVSLESLRISRKEDGEYVIDPSIR